MDVYFRIRGGLRSHNVGAGMKVYIAGPYSSNPVQGTRDAIWAAHYVMGAGDVPFVPHLTMFWDFLKPQPYEAWLAYDMEWLRVCDALIRLPGASKGADGEEAEALKLGLKIFHGLPEYWEHTGRL